MPATKTDTEILGNSPLFAGISPDELERLSALLRDVSLKPGASMFMQDDAPDGCYAIFEGTVTVSVVTQTGEESLLAVLGDCLLYTSPSPRDRQKSRMPSSA